MTDTKRATPPARVTSPTATRGVRLLPRRCSSRRCSSLRPRYGRRSSRRSRRPPRTRGLAAAPRSFAAPTPAMRGNCRTPLPATPIPPGSDEESSKPCASIWSFGTKRGEAELNGPTQSITIPSRGHPRTRTWPIRPSPCAKRTSVRIIPCVVSRSLADVGGFDRLGKSWVSRSRTRTCPSTRIRSEERLAFDTMST